jgi:hypothetical protein
MLQVSDAALQRVEEGRRLGGEMRKMEAQPQGTEPFGWGAARVSDESFVIH